MVGASADVGVPEVVASISLMRTSHMVAETYPCKYKSWRRAHDSERLSRFPNTGEMAVSSDKTFRAILWRTAQSSSQLWMSCYVLADDQKISVPPKTMVAELVLECRACRRPQSRH